MKWHGFSSILEELKQKPPPVMHIFDGLDRVVKIIPSLPCSWLIGSVFLGFLEICWAFVYIFVFDTS